MQYWAAAQLPAAAKTVLEAQQGLGEGNGRTGTSNMFRSSRHIKHVPLQLKI
jgi:hypothetical protein